MSLPMTKRSILSVLGAGIFLWTVAPADATGQHVERHFAVQGRPVGVIQNIADGRIEVKSWKNPQLGVSGARSSDKIGIHMAQTGDRIAESNTLIDRAAESPD